MISTSCSLFVFFFLHCTYMRIGHLAVSQVPEGLGYKALDVKEDGYFQATCPSGSLSVLIFDPHM